ncbi:probable RNA-binding protein 19 [Sciurus carolinensis]|uniref:probable RNA-binding protein 19 n=1 Tax=Sciurus carolinensis TaxID=30640 RepID=UPI001FB1FC8C|nr:probable RNA-binding protein 19 [Sciurus carolinensis]
MSWNIMEFLAPLKPVAIRIVRNMHGNKTGYVFVDFSSEEGVKKALKCDRVYMGGCYIKVFREKHVPTAKGTLQNSVQPWQGRTLQKDEEEEDLADSGRLFVHNLLYTSTEENLKGLFSPYGPLSELHYPIKSMTKEPKDFNFVTFTFPEHTVKVCAAVDGQVFQKSKGSVAVRVALGETQLVQEVWHFLLHNVFNLDSFSQAAPGASSSMPVVAGGLQFHTEMPI